MAKKSAPKLSDATLRDLFAAFALLGLLIKYGPDTPIKRARIAYDYADKMMKARR